MKTYKREVSIMALAYLGVMFVWGVYNAEAMQAAQFLTNYIFGVVTLAFGADAYAKQIKA